MSNNFIESTLKIDDFDFGEKDLVELFKFIDANEPHVAVGVIGEKKYIKQPGGGGTIVPPSIVDVAIFQEFGTVAQVTSAMRGWFKKQGYSLSPTTKEIRTPARSFIRSTADQKRDEIIKVIDGQVENLLDGKTSIKKALSTIGTFIQAETQKMFESSDFAPLSEFTILRKKSSKPLIDTGRLRQSIAYDVRFNR